MKIGVSGASGKLGRKVLENLSTSGGHHLVGISRSPETSPAPIEGRRGDYDEPASLVSAYQGLDRLLLIPSADLRPGVRGRQLAAAIDAAQQAGVSHVVLMSAAGTKEALENSVGGAYWTGEQHLIKTAPHWTILRMNYYAESMAEEIQMSLGMNVLTGLGDERVAYVSTGRSGRRRCWRAPWGRTCRRDLQRDRTGHRERPRQGHHRVGTPRQASQLRGHHGGTTSRVACPRPVCPRSSSTRWSRSRRRSCRAPSTF